MSFSLPGFNLFYLSRDNLEPEKYELITRPSVTWDYIRQEYEFDDRYRDHFHVEGLRPRPSCSRSYAYQNNHSNGFNTERRLRYLVFRGEVVMLNRYGSPGELFYIDEEGWLICRNYHVFEMNGAERILREYRNSVGCRYYRSGKPRPTSFALSFSGGISAPASEPTYQTINSKAAGRLLAAGGVYNGNIEGFRKTAEQLGRDAVKGYDQVLNEQTAGTAIAAASILLAKRPNPQLYEEMTNYLGKLRGEPRIVNGITITDINYIKRNSAEAALLRKEFDSTVRRTFIKEIANTPDAVNIFSSSQLLRMKNGKSPEGWDVHHKLPLDDSGTNSFNNLVLIEKEPYHKIFTNMQRSAAKNLVPGESRITPWAIPTGSIYPHK
ncbi:TPA: HNH endonuclease signature motif containing protein [Enterobacter cloacae]|uniref:HNH endonuclease signature motif containing protein n=1 Tax=Enterobacter cloacae TaxID=550 RepID=UPI0014297263|nr:HNH endonuclease signature motif containing protein [Enterobacter cloacae]EBW8988149.1 HNH endonuclease [Salmonella enterica subsp. enterica serovar Enteritidis]